MCTFRKMKNRVILLYLLEKRIQQRNRHSRRRRLKRFRQRQRKYYLLTLFMAFLLAVTTFAPSNQFGRRKGVVIGGIELFLSPPKKNGRRTSE